MALIGRIFVIFFAMLAATLIAGIAIAIAALGPYWHGFSGDVGDQVGFWVAVFFATSFVGSVGILPAAVLIAVAEALKVRSLVVYLAAGAVLLLAGYYGFGMKPVTHEQTVDRQPPFSRGAEIAAAAGAVFGLAYWLIAGRNAGRWREPRRPVA